MAFKQSKTGDAAHADKKEHFSNASPIKTSPFKVAVNRSAKDMIVISCILFSAFLFLILYSYQDSDPGFLVSGAASVPLNYGGRAGAWLASFILYLLGIFGFLIPFGVFMAGWVTLKIRVGSSQDYARFGLSLLGLILLIISGSAMASLYLEPKLSFINLPYSGGGVLGYELSQALVKRVDLLGTTLILLGTFAISFSLFTSFSWLTILEKTGQYISFGFGWGYQKLQARWGQLKTLYQNKWSQVKVPSVNAEKIPRIDEEAALKTQTDSPKKRVEEVVKHKKSKVASFLKTKKTSKVKEKVNKVNDASEVSEPENSTVEVKTPQESTEPKKIPVVESGDLPSVELLDPIPVYEDSFSKEDLTALSLLLEKSLKEFNIQVKVESVQPGPVVTRFEILPAPGVKVSQINNLAKDLARVLSVKSVRVVDVIPGKAFVGIEIPNDEREMVSFREVISSDAFQNSDSPLTVALGKDIAGKTVVTDIAKMPHLLVAGTTGSGKSVGVNSMILSLLYKSTPEEVRLIMVDPKMLELSIYEDIPHLLTPVVTDMGDAANALRWCVFEMDRRYQLMAKLGVRNIAGYNAKVKGAIDDGKPIIDPLYQQAANFGHELGETPPTLEPLPFIVVVVDEFADMIMVVGKEVEQLIARIAQKARAAGIHLILATQRPSVNVITGLIKANIPTRISFMVNTKIDSRTILDQGGAEQLLGMGDMLFMPPGSGTPRRVHGAFMTDEEVHKVAEFVKSQGKPRYLPSVTQAPVAETEENGADAEQDQLYDEVVEFVIQGRKVSVSSVQRRFKVGYNRAARLVEAMERAGLISTMGANGNREVLAPKTE